MTLLKTKYGQGLLLDMRSSEGISGRVLIREKKDLNQCLIGISYSRFFVENSISLVVIFFLSSLC